LWALHFFFFGTERFQKIVIVLDKVQVALKQFFSFFPASKSKDKQTQGRKRNMENKEKNKNKASYNHREKNKNKASYNHRSRGLWVT
jgi:hypothetical protein